MTGVPVGLVLALIDAADQASGGPGIMDRGDEKLVRYLRNSPGRGSSGSFRWNPYGSKGYPSRGGGGPSRRTPPRRAPSKGWYYMGRGRYVPANRYKGYKGKPRWNRKRCPSGYYYSYKHRRCMKSKFR